MNQQNHGIFKNRHRHMMGRLSRVFVWASLCGAVCSIGTVQAAAATQAAPPPLLVPVPQAVAPVAVPQTMPMIDSMVLVDQTPQQALDLLGKLTGRMILTGSGLPKFVINFNSSGPISQTDAIRAIESILSMNGVSIIEEGDKYLKAVQSSSAKNYAPRLLEEHELAQLPIDEKVYSKIFTLSYLSVQEAGSILYPMMTPRLSAMFALDKANAVLITDVLSNIRRVETILKRIDVPAKLQEKVFFFPLKNVSASEMEKRLTSLDSKLLKKYIRGNTSFDSDPRTNQLIVITPEGNIPVIKNIIDGLDIKVPSLTQQKVTYLRYADAVKVVELLKRIMQGQKAGKSAADKESRSKDDDEIKSKLGDEAGKLAANFSDKVVIEADERSNAVVAFGSEADIAFVDHIVGKMDCILPQVRIEVIITEVTLLNGQVSGLEQFGYNYNGKKSTFGLVMPSLAGNVTLASPLSGTPVGTTVPPAGITINQFTWDTILKAAETNTKINIIANPTILLTHNQKGKISNTESRPFITKTSTVAPSTTAAGTAQPANVIGNEIEQKDVGIVLEVKPLIGRDGVIQLDINQKYDTLTGGTTINNIPQPYVTKREAQSFVSVRDGEIIILGGFREKTVEKTKKKMFILGSLPIPFFKDMFSPTSDDVITKEVIMFIRPHVLQTTDAAYAHSKKMLENSISRPDIDAYLNDGKIDDKEMQQYWKNEEAQRKIKTPGPRSTLPKEPKVADEGDDFKPTTIVVPAAPQQESVAPPQQQLPPQQQPAAPPPKFTPGPRRFRQETPPPPASNNPKPAFTPGPRR